MTHFSFKHDEQCRFRRVCTCSFLKLHILSDIIDVGSRSLISYTSVPHLHAVVDDSQSHSKPGTVPLNIRGSSVFLRRCCSCRIVSSLSVPSSWLSAEWQHWERKTKPVNVCGVSCSREGLKPWHAPADHLISVVQ